MLVILAVLLSILVTTIALFFATRLIRRAMFQKEERKQPIVEEGIIGDIDLN